MTTAELQVELGYDAGWLTLSLRSAESELSVRGTTLAPIVADLVAGLQDIADGRRAVSVRWDGEPGGVFLDFAQGEAGWKQRPLFAGGPPSGRGSTRPAP